MYADVRGGDCDCRDFGVWSVSLMRNMSFSKTTVQMYEGTKDVTRRHIDTWKSLKAGDRLRAVEKSRGLKKGEKVNPICEIEVVDVRVERIYHVTNEEVRREGFPGMNRYDFAKLLGGVMRCHIFDECRRVEFRIVRYL